MIRVDSTFYCDVVLLLVNGVDIEEATKNQIASDGVYELDVIYESVDEDLLEVLDECPIETLLRYISVLKEEVEVNYEETYQLGDPRLVAFDVPILFDDGEFRRKVALL